MPQTNPKVTLAVAPSSRGFGFAVLEGQNHLIDWGIKTARTSKNIQSLSNLKVLLRLYEPDCLVLENIGKNSMHYPRIVRLYSQILKLASKERIKVKTFSREKLLKAFLPDGQGTRHDLATVIASKFPDQLLDELPPKRKTGDSENPKMDVLVAVGLALLLYVKIQHEANHLLLFKN